MCPTKFMSVNENHDIATVCPGPAQSIMSIRRFVIANLEFESLPSRAAPASGLLNTVSDLAVAPVHTRGPETTTGADSTGVTGAAGPGSTGAGVDGAAVTVTGNSISVFPT